MAKLKQRGFQEGAPFAKGLKKEAKALAQTEPEKEKSVASSKPEKVRRCMRTIGVPQ